MYKILITFFLFSVLSGCTNNYRKVSDDRMQAIQFANQQIGATFTNCQKKREQNVNLNPLLGLLFNNDGSRPLAMLNNSNYLDDSKKPALEELDRMTEQCKKDMSDTLDRNPIIPYEMRSILLLYFDSSKTNRSDLWAKKITIAEYIKKRDEASNKMGPDLSAAAKKMDEEFYATLNDAEARDRANSLATQQLYQSQQRINIQQQQIQQQQNQNSYVPLTNSFTPLQNNTTRCRSYMTGNQMNTDCN